MDMEEQLKPSQEENATEDLVPETETEAPVMDTEAAVDAEATPAVPQDPLAQLTAERDALKDQLMRMAAEFDNYRKRTARESAQIRKTAAASLVRGLLPVLDNLERALNHATGEATALSQGVEMIMKQLKDALASAGLEAIDAVGQPFDPQVHEALTHQPSEEHPADHVALEFERGYRLGDTVLRAAKVVVSSGPAAEAAPEDTVN